MDNEFIPENANIAEDIDFEMQPDFTECYCESTNIS